MTLIEFLLIQIGEDEADAQQSEHDLDRWERETTQNGADGSQGSIVASNLRGGALDPQRVLAECEAKRRIIEGFVEAGRYYNWLQASEAERDADMERYRIAKLLALPYANHPNYRWEWRP